MAPRDLVAVQAGASPQALTRIPTVRHAQELLDTAFSKASRITVPAKDPVDQVKITEIARVRSVQNSLDAVLAKYVRRFPSFDRLPPFYHDLVDLLVDLDRLRKALGAIDWARKRVVEVGDETVKEMRTSRRPDFIRARRKHMYGRVSSLLKQVDKDLRFMDEARNAVRRLPMVDVDAPTIVVAGFPNVGKSSFIREVSTAEPAVAAYPFTTTGVSLGHFEHDHVRYQVVDTPGLLDREFAERNDIERQAVLALQHLADAVLFILDPSGYCGYPLLEQERLLAEVREAFPEAPVVVAENKVDLITDRAVPEGRHRMSTETGEGVDDVVNALLDAIDAAGK